MLSALQPIAPRYYSISSSSMTGRSASASPRSCTSGVLDISFRCVRTVRPKDHPLLRRQETDSQDIWGGLCSTYLAQRSPGDTIQIAVRPSSFRLPIESGTPIIMIAGGIGIAPFRAFLLDRLASATSRKNFGPSLLLYGVRSASETLYEDLLKVREELVLAGTGTAVHHMSASARRTS